MRFNNIFGNPPFQDSENQQKTQHKIWPIFTEKAVNEWLVDGGNLIWISPYSWGSPSNKILTLLKENHVSELNLDTDQFFPNVGSSFSHYKIVKTDNKSPTSVTKNGKTFPLMLDNSVQYIPNDVCDESMSIHSKVMFANSNCFNVNYDYVTCHNVIRHAPKLHEKKIEKTKEAMIKLIMSENPGIDFDKKILPSISKKLSSLQTLISERSSVDITISEVETDKHIYPVFHTNNKIWFSSKLQDFASSKKVMWSRSGYVKPFYDDGALGCTDMGYYILVDSDIEGKRLVKFLSSNLMKYIFKTAKWSGFGNELVFSSIPKIDLSKDMKESDYYAIFNISSTEQDYIDSILNPKKEAKEKKSDAETKSQKRVKKHGEVYTPQELVLLMLDMLPAANWANEDETFIDPACGNGNFLVEILIRRLDSGVPVDKAISTLYGIDILQDNIDECVARLSSILIERGYDPKNFMDTINANIVLSNSLERPMEKIFVTELDNP